MDRMGDSGSLGTGSIPVESIIKSRKHNNANILALGGRIITSELAKEIVLEFLKTEFEGGRHLLRINKI